MPDLDALIAALEPARLPAYVGLGPGQEFIPYFLSLLALVGSALLAMVYWPFLKLRAWFSGRKRETEAPPHDAAASTNQDTAPPEAPRR
jgi:hypothetical protein